MKNKSGYRGYISSRPVRGEMTPQHIQNLIVREYAKQNDLLFLLSATEYAMQGCYLILEEVLEALDTLEGIICFTLFMLPKKRAKRLEIYERVLESGSSLHAALEGISLVAKSDIQRFEDLFLVQQHAAGEVPAELRHQLR